MKKIFFILILIGFIGILFLVNRHSSGDSIRELTGWSLKPGAEFETIRKRWNQAWGETIWLLNEKFLTDKDKSMFHPCKPMPGKEVLSRFPELNSKLSFKDSFCVLSKEHDDAYINIYLGSEFAIVHYAI